MRGNLHEPMHTSRRLFCFLKEVRLINRFDNEDGHRVCDYSDDRKTVVIERKGCITRITANPDGTLNIENVPKAA